MNDYLRYKFSLVFYLLLLFTIPVISQYAPGAGIQGTTAIHKDSSVFVNWATNCSVRIGQEDISNPQSNLASAGDSSMAVGLPGSGIVSLGDGGEAILTFERFIKNGPGWDFAIFENSFNNTFLELGFVEVSSNGTDYFRFPSASLTQDTIQIDAFGSINPTNLNNLAGKYRANYGTPFDLEEFINEPSLDINSISHVKIIDVIGSIDSNYCNYDQFSNKINDPFPTPFISSGFDLDAVGVINEAPLDIFNINHSDFLRILKISNRYIEYSLNSNQSVQFNVSIFDLTGKMILQKTEMNNTIKSNKIDLKTLKSGIYILNISTRFISQSHKFILN